MLKIASVSHLRNKYLGYKLNADAVKYYEGIIQRAKKLKDYKGRIDQDAMKRERILIDLKIKLSGGSTKEN